MLGGHHEAEDALQQVFVDAHRHLVDSDNDILLRPWLYAVARNRCLSLLRARRPVVALDSVAEPEWAGLAVGAEVERRQDLQDLLSDLARLPEEQRAALVLSELGALSHDEIAVALAVRREKVKALVFQAREALMGWKEARGVDCREIREQLSTMRGGALRRAPLRRHLDNCAECSEYREAVRSQRAALAIILPVVPSLALKHSVLTAALTAGGAGGGAAAGAAGGVVVAAGAGSGLTSITGGIAAKALIAALVTVGAGGGGYAALQKSADDARGARPPVLAAGSLEPAASPTHISTPIVTSGARRKKAAPARHKARAHRKHSIAASGKQHVVAPVRAHSITGSGKTGTSGSGKPGPSGSGNVSHGGSKGSSPSTSAGGGGSAAGGATPSLAAPTAPTTAPSTAPTAGDHSGTNQGDRHDGDDRHGDNGDDHDGDNGRHKGWTQGNHRGWEHQGGTPTTVPPGHREDRDNGRSSHDD